MRVVSTRTHGLADGAFALFLTSSPWLLPFGRGGAETWIMVAVGLAVLGYSLITTYEFGRRSLLSIRAHLMLDAAVAGLLAVSPWLFGFADLVWAPHLLLGLLFGCLSALTELTPFRAEWRSLVGQ